MRDPNGSIEGDIRDLKQEIEELRERLSAAEGKNQALENILERLFQNLASGIGAPSFKMEELD